MLLCPYRSICNTPSLYVNSYYLYRGAILRSRIQRLLKIRDGQTKITSGVGKCRTQLHVIPQHVHGETGIIRGRDDAALARIADGHQGHLCRGQREKYGYEINKNDSVVT